MPGDLLLGWLPALALVALAINDWYLKGRGPGWFTGKLSDVAGLFLLPLILVSLTEVIRRCANRPWQVTSRACAVVCWTVGVGFALVKTLEPVASAYGWAIGLLRWPLQAVSTMLTGGTLTGPLPVEVIVDPTDLLTLVSVPCAYAYMRWRRPPLNT